MAALALSAGSLMAQNEYDALRFSQTYIQGTSRSAAMGGAFGALGGDGSVTAINPAGIGVYSQTELSFSFDFLANTYETSPTSGQNSSSKYAMKMPNLSFVMSGKNGRTTGFTGWSFGITSNRTNDFTGKESYNYVNNSNSMLDSWCDRAQGIPEGQLSAFNTGLAFDTYLLDTTSAWNYCNPHMTEWSGVQGGYGQTQLRQVISKGGINEWNFTFSGAFYEKLFIGGSIGCNSLRYEATSTYEEIDNQNTLPYDYWRFKEEFKTTGSGWNFKLGVLVKPTNFLRFGAAIHTPTFNVITDEYYSTAEAQYDDGVFDAGLDSYYDAISTNNKNKYELNTPFKAILSGAFIVPGYGLLSIDYEAVDYTSCELGPASGYDSYSYIQENNAIANKFQKTNNFRLGAEGLIGPMAVRAGYAIYGNPYKFVNTNRQRSILSFGLGFRGESFNFDVAAAYHIYQTDGFLYESNNEAHTQRVSYDNRYLHVMATLGFRFD